MFGTLLAGLLTALAAAETGPGGEIRATFIGNAAVHLTDGRVAIVTDFPYRSGAFGYMTWSPKAVPTGPAPLCVISHSHADHFAAGRVTDYCGSLLGPQDVVRGAKVEVPVLKTAVIWEGIAIHPTATPHGSLENYSFLIVWSGKRIYLTGDTEDPTALLATRNLDIAFVTPWLLKTVKAKGERIDARQVVVYHHRKREKVVEAQERIVPVQGQVLSIGPR